MTIKPLNDVALIEVEANPHNKAGLNLVASKKEEGIETGTLIALPDQLPYVASNGWSFENSFAEWEKLKTVLEYYKPLIGKKVVWEKLAEMGTEVDHEGKRYVLLKLTKLLAVYED